MTEILFLTHNRLEFARASFEELLANTDWSLVDRLWLFDDTSRDGTQHEVLQWARRSPAEAKIVRGSWGSPVTALGEFAGVASSPLLAKIDSDTMLPPGWLNDCVAVMDKSDVSLLGIEARGRANAFGHVTKPDAAPAGVEREADPAEWIGGIGVFRRSAFDGVVKPHVAIGEGKWFGWQAWQIRAATRGVKAGWIKPSLQVFLLDRMPMDPWRSLSLEYIHKGWQRKEPYLYGPDSACLWDWHKGAKCA